YCNLGADNRKARQPATACFPIRFAVQFYRSPVVLLFRDSRARACEGDRKTRESSTFTLLSPHPVRTKGALLVYSWTTDMPMAFEWRRYSCGFASVSLYVLCRQKVPHSVATRDCTEIV